MFIVIEGADGVGKATQAKRLADRLGALLLSFPRYDTPVGKAILRHLRGEIVLAEATVGTRPRAPEDAVAFQCMTLADKYDAASAIVAALQQGRDVVCDRWTPSALVYGFADGLDPEWLRSVHSRLPVPDLNILLDLEAEDSLKRRPELRDRYEKDGHLQVRVRAIYRTLWLAHGGDPAWASIDGTGPVNEVGARIDVHVARRR